MHFQNHTVTSGNPFAGCQPDYLINSGFVPVSAPAAPPAVAPTGSLTPRGLNNILEKKGEAMWFPPPFQPKPDSGYSGNLPTFKITMFDFRPLTLYCAQALHCQNGMVMTINPTPFVRSFTLCIDAANVNLWSRVQQLSHDTRAYPRKQART
jgi:hypothetical protein